MSGRGDSLFECDGGDDGLNSNVEARARIRPCRTIGALVERWLGALFDSLLVGQSVDHIAEETKTETVSISKSLCLTSLFSTHSYNKYSTPCPAQVPDHSTGQLTDSTPVAVYHEAQERVRRLDWIWTAVSPWAASRWRKAL